MCIAPLTLKTEKEEWVNNGHGSTRTVPCGKCPDCRKDQARAWSFRLSQEAKNSVSCSFLTMTYEHEPKSFNKHGTLYPQHVTNFIKKLRKHGIPNIPIKYYLSGEYGSKHLRPHYHLILFNLPQELQHFPDTIQEIWGHGMCHLVPANPSTINYTLKYIMQGVWKPKQDDDDRHPQYSRMSKNLGLGYLTPQTVKYHVEHRTGVITLQGGIVQKMPRYYKDKIFSKGEKATIAHEQQEIRKLNWNEWIKQDWAKPTREYHDKQRKHQNELKNHTETL